MTREHAVAVDEPAAIRDIPSSCICGDWQPTRTGWTLGRPRGDCPWHVRYRYPPVPFTVALLSVT